MDEALLDDLKRDHTLVITLEDGVLDGGFGEKIARYYGPSDMKVLNYGVKKEFIDRYDVEASRVGFFSSCAIAFVASRAGTVISSARMLLLIFFAFILLVIVRVILLPSFPPLFFCFPGKTHPTLFCVLHRIHVFPSV